MAYATRSGLFFYCANFEIPIQQNNLKLQTQSKPVNKTKLTVLANGIIELEFDTAKLHTHAGSG